jgi:PAS domain S-box-containing protein
MTILSQVFDPAYYVFSIYSLPTLVTTLGILLLGMVVLFRERMSLVSVSFFVMTLTISTWLFCFSIVYSTHNSSVALWWMKASYLGVPLIAPATYQFTITVLRLYGRYRHYVWAAWLVSAMWVVVAIRTGWMFHDTYRFWWGYYPRFEWPGLLFIACFCTMLIANMVHFWHEYRTAPPGTHRQRIKWFMVAFATGYVGVIDFIACYGLPLYPFGYVAIFGFLIVAARTIWLYRLVDITPAFAARQITDTMSDALLVLDAQGVIRVANPAAGRLLGYDPQTLVGRRVSGIISDPLFQGNAEQLVHAGIVHDYEVTYTTPEQARGRAGIITATATTSTATTATTTTDTGAVGAAGIVMPGPRVLSFSTSVMHNASPVGHAEPVAIVCIARDVTERKQAEERIKRQLERLAALRNIDIAITASHDLHVTLGVILEQVTGQLQVDAACVLLLNTHEQTLEYAAGRGFRTHGVARTRIRIGYGHVGGAARHGRSIFIPDLAASASADDPERAVLLAEERFVSYYAIPLIARGQVRGVLEVMHRSPLNPSADWLGFAAALAGQAAIAVDNASLFQDLQRKNVELALAYDTTLEGWSRALDLRDHETEGHTERVTGMTVRLAHAIGMSADDIVHVRRGALLHDIGKMAIPDSILLKPGPLTEEEWRIMRMHPVYAYELLSPIEFLRPALDIPYCHHERWDGSGYPRGLRGNQIPLAARLFAVVDVWDALRSDRPYRRAWPEAKVRDFLVSMAGKHFEPIAVEAFMDIVGDALPDMACTPSGGADHQEQPAHTISEVLESYRT